MLVLNFKYCPFFNFALDKFCLSHDGGAVSIVGLSNHVVCYMPLDATLPTNGVVVSAYFAVTIHLAFGAEERLVNVWIHLGV